MYRFDGLRPGIYAVREDQPAGYLEGKDVLGTINDLAAGTAAAKNEFSGLVLTPGAIAMNYNFGELEPAEGRVIGSGQTASIGFWNNKNGQALIKALNGGPQATQLGDWLAATLPNLYGNLAGKTNAQVAVYYQQLFSKKGSLLGTTKLDAQVMAVALATYVTNSSLAGTTAVKYGFAVNDNGVGLRTINVALCGAAFGVTNWTVHSVLELLWATDARSFNGRLYDLDRDGRVDAPEWILQIEANLLYTLINELGHIG